MNWKNLFRKKLTADEAMQILGMPKNFSSMYFLYIVGECNLTTTTKLFHKSMCFFEDEITKLRDSAHPALQTVRKQAQMSREQLITRLGYNQFIKMGALEAAEAYKQMAIEKGEWAE